MARKNGNHKEQCKGCGEMYMPNGEGVPGFCCDPACQMQGLGPETVLAFAEYWYEELDGRGDAMERARRN